MHSQVTSTREDAQPVRSPAALRRRPERGERGRMSRAFASKVRPQPTVRTPTVPSPGTQTGGLAAGEPARQAPSPAGGRWRSAKAFWPGELGHEPGTELFGHVHADAFLTQAERHKSLGPDEAQATTSSGFRTTTFKALFCCLSNILGTCTAL